jgi:hypothetical protein
MKIDVDKEVRVQTTVTIDSEDIEQMLNQRLVELTDPDLCERFLLGLVQDCWQVLKAITPEMINRVKAKNRRLVYDGLSDQVTRWKPNCKQAALDPENL